jgi:hypothetical protein
LEGNTVKFLSKPWRHTGGSRSTAPPILKPR